MTLQDSTEMDAFIPSLKTCQFERLIKSQDDVEWFIQVILFKKQLNFENIVH